MFSHAEQLRSAHFVYAHMKIVRHLQQNASNWCYPGLMILVFNDVDAFSWFKLEQRAHE